MGGGATGLFGIGIGPTTGSGLITGIGWITGCG
jgi:hypothetical protein